MNIADIRFKWAATFARGSSLTSLREGVRYNSSQSPCIVGYRSLCWKVFLVFGELKATKWCSFLSSQRELYSSQSQRLLQYIQHPEALAMVSTDPLDDDPTSPWNTVRQDTLVLDEINQDVRRLPDHPFYHQSHIQRMISNILFMYCKLNPDKDGYRQGMHEIVAPLVLILSDDAVNRSQFTDPTPTDETMLHIIDLEYVEHDAFILFSCIMKTASSFYQINAPVSLDNAPLPATADVSTLLSSDKTLRAKSPTVSSIVTKSKYIYEICLRKIDPELFSHLNNYEIPPQIFLIRWIRLLFSREFPFSSLLKFWDLLFAVDPNLELIDLICVAMILRIRWQLMDSDNSGCLQLLLKYPAPTDEYGPQTFIEDAIHLKLQMNPVGGSYIVEKHTGKPLPTIPINSVHSNTTPSLPSVDSFKNKSRTFIGRSPLSSTSKFLAQPTSMDDFIQGARGMFEKGERLEINKAVRYAMEEFRKNVQQFQEAASSQPIVSAESRILLLEKRNRKLSSMVGDLANSLRGLSATGPDDHTKYVDIMELLAAKIQFVQLALEDSSIEIPDIVFSTTGISYDLVANTSKEQVFVPSDTSSDPLSTKTKSIEDPTVNDQFVSIETPLDQESPTGLNADQSHKISDSAIEDTHPSISRSYMSSSTTNSRILKTQSKDNRALNSDTISAPKTRVSNQNGILNSTFNTPVRYHGNDSRERNAFLFGETTTTIENNIRESRELFGLDPAPKSRSGHNKSVAHIFGDDGG